MIIHPLTFAGFVLLTLVIYYSLEHRLQKYLLLTASYIFYFTWSWQFPVVLAIITAFNFGWAFTLRESNHRRPLFLWIGIIFNVGFLIFFKYSDFFVPAALALFKQMGMPFRLETLKILLPVGLSFYILQTISYLVDVYRKQCPPSKNPVNFALYLAYFPKLTAGPIERAKSFLTQIQDRKIVDETMISESATLIATGLVRKIVVADPLLAAIPQSIFRNPSSHSPIELAAWMIAYIFGLYNDFCGYTNIARGVSGLFGIRLSRNFAQPFFSRNLTEIWTRWHISLSLWLRDYIYFPLSRALVRRNPSRTNTMNIILPPLITMAISGFWHGRELHFVVWGVMIGVFLIIERILNLVKPGEPMGKRPLYRQLIGMTTVFGLVFFTVIFFRLEIPLALQFLDGLFTWTSTALPDSRIFLLIIPALWIDWIQYRHQSEFVFMKWPLFRRAAVLALALIAIFLSAMPQTPSPFIYQGF